MDAFPLAAGRLVASPRSCSTCRSPPPARRCESGVLAFPAGDDLSTVEDAAELGQIRLAKPGAVSSPPEDGSRA